MVNCFIALNVSYEDTLLNDSTVPIIFYWDGISDIQEDIKSNEHFMDMLNRKCLSVEKYSKAIISLCYINDDNSHEYGDYTISIEEILPFEDIKDNDFMFGYVSEILLKLYKKVFKMEYVRNDIDDLNFKVEMRDIIKKIREYLGRPISNETILNYILSQLDEQFKLSEKNKTWLIEKVKLIFEES
jgi:hypothetical protein